MKAVLLLFVCATTVVSGTRIEIAFSKESSSRLHKRQTGACSDYIVVEKSTLFFPNGFESLSKPWERDTVTVINSSVVTEGMNTMFVLAVPGLNGMTIKNVLDKFREQGCLCFPYGGSVRDQFLEKTPNNFDMEVSCTKEEIETICLNNWGSNNCKSSTSVVRIGNNDIGDGNTDGIDCSTWHHTFFENIYLEYTTNSLAFDPNDNNVVIDLPGNGVQDTCNRKIRIPVPISQWDTWSETKKLYRFWKLRTKGYTAVTEETKNYIVNNAESYIMNNPNSFKTFYCIYILSGKPVTNTNLTCTLSNCNSAQQLADPYNDVFNEDMGEFWNMTAKPLVTNAVHFERECSNSGAL